MPDTVTPFGAWNPGELFRFGVPVQLAPQSLVQPILPGWSFNINSHNSTAPQTEVDVVSQHSYGRQIGRISDALHALILAQHGGKLPAGKPFAEFDKMWNEVEDVKAKSAAARLDRIGDDLALLKKSDPKAYERLRASLREALERTG